MNILNQNNNQSINNSENPITFPDIRTGVVYMLHYYTSNLHFTVSTPVRSDAVFGVVHPDGSYRAELLINGGIIEFDDSHVSDLQPVLEVDVADFYADSCAKSLAFKERERLENFNKFINEVKADIHSGKARRKNISKTYFILNTETRLIKIGKSINPDQRLKDIQGMAGAKLKMMAVIDKNIEHELHIYFKEYRRIGEWFDDSKGVIADFIKQLTNK